MPDEYTDLHEILPDDVWGEFSYADYYNGEQNILKPALEKLGYYDVRFYMGERDSFGPLSRVVKASHPDGAIRAIYG